MRKNNYNPQRTQADLSIIEKDIYLYIRHLPPPVSIDNLIRLSEASVTAVLNATETLKGKNIIHEKKEYGKGFYFPNDNDFTSFDEGHSLDKNVRRIISRIIHFYRSLPEKISDKETLNLADLYIRTGDSDEGIAIIKKAADILARSGQVEKSVNYYEYILRSFADRTITKATVDDFLDSVLGRISLLIYHMSAKDELVHLDRARDAAIRFKKRESLARIEIVLAQVLQTLGEHKKALKCFSNFQQLADDLGQSRTVRSAILNICEFLFWKGRFSDVIKYYEKTIGGLEKFGDDIASLKAAALVGYCFVICGRVARGIGIIETVSAKGTALGLQQVFVFADQMAAISLLEIRRIPEAQFYVDRLYGFSEEVLGHLISRGIYDERAYILCTQKEYEKAFEYHRKGVDRARSLGWKHQCGPWVFEYLDVLESRGFVAKDVNYDSETKRLTKWDDLRMKGAAFRYRAVRNMERRKHLGSVLSDLRMSERYLRQSGAEIELARTRIALGRYYLAKKETKTARSHLEKAWSVLSRIDKNLFPKDLLAIMPEERKLEAMLERVININKSLGAIRDRASFLEKVIEVAMDFTMATRGSFMILGPDSKPMQITSRNLDLSFIQKKEFNAARKIIDNVLLKGQELVVPSPVEDEGLPSGKDPHAYEMAFRQAGISSFMGVPAELAEQTRGYLCLDNRLGGGPFSQNHLFFLRFLCSQISVGLSNLDTYKEMKELKDRFEEEAIFYKREMGIAAPVEIIVGKSEETKKVIDQIRQVAPTDSSVMVLGETGVGKELVAKAIHNLSTRKDGPFIPVNIAVLPHELVASELFGHEKGAFTGADNQQKGRFELAHGGTIFLDEIGDLPAQVQTKLLRVLQEGTFERLGSGKEIKSDFRVIAATNKDLRKEVEKGTFRQDLYYRLCVFPITVPPLRERTDDIPVLARHFLQKFGRKLGKTIKRIPSEEMKKLLAHNWPGNVRELEHCIENALILSDGAGIAFSEFESRFAEHGPDTPFRVMPIAEMEREYIEKILAMTRGKVTGPGGAASYLKLKPNTLFSRMKKLGVRKPGIIIPEG